MSGLVTLHKSKTFRVAAFASLLVLIISAVWYELRCSEPRFDEPQQGTHGYRTWKGENIQSFLHTGRRVCVAPEWRAVGALSEGEGWAKFERGTTAVLIRASTFQTEMLEPVGSRFLVEVIYPSSINVETYRPLIMRVFEEHAELFETDLEARTRHEVLITASAEPMSIYPDPTAVRTILTRGADDPRGGELAYHAVAHLYNRFGNITYAQEPFSKGDFEELVATWSEIALMDLGDNRRARVDYLYRVHSAVMTNNFLLIQGPPFSDREAFEAITPSMIVPDSGTYLDFQYGHYILAPLVAVALDGLLSHYDSSVFSLLRDVHFDSRVNFMEAVRRKLSNEEYESVQNWIAGKQLIPWDAVARGLATY